jgi:hypothetical protein
MAGVKKYFHEPRALHGLLMYTTRRDKEAHLSVKYAGSDY